MEITVDWLRSRRHLDENAEFTTGAISQDDLFDGVVGGGDGMPHLIRHDIVERSDILEGLADQTWIDRDIVRLLSLHPQSLEDFRKTKLAGMTITDRYYLLQKMRDALGIAKLLDEVAPC